MEIKMSDEEILAKLEHRYSLLDELITAVAEKHIDGLMISGSGGIGKTFAVQQAMKRYENIKQVKSFTGHITPLQTYNTLWEYRTFDSIVVFDDCDSAFEDTKSMNILKAAVDTLPVRVISWESNTPLLEGPSRFQFDGGVIIVSNLNLRSSVHYAAFSDRILHFHLELTPREKLVKIKDIAAKTSDIDSAVATKVINWIEEDWNKLEHGLTLRTFVKTVKLATFSKNWRELAWMMMFRNGNVR